MIALLGAREPGVLAEGEKDVLLDGHGVKEGGLLEEEADLGANLIELGGFCLIDALIAEPHLAAIGLDESDDVLEDDRLSNAGGAEHDRGLTLGEVHGGAAEDALGAEPFVEFDESHDGGVGRGGRQGCGRRFLCFIVGKIHAAIILDMGERIERQLIHKGSKFDFEQVTTRTSSGAIVTREVVRHPGAVVIVPILGDGRLALIRNYRVAVGKKVWELPAGTIDPGEEPNVCASRELVEETGYEAGELTPLGAFFTTPGMTDELMHAFAATDLREVGQKLEEGEDIELRLVPTAEAIGMIDSGELADGKSMVAILLAERRGLLSETVTAGEVHKKP